MASDMAKNRGHKGMLDRMALLDKLKKASDKGKDAAKNAARAKAQKSIKRSLAADVNDERYDLIEAIMWAIVEAEGKEEKIKAMKKQHDEFKKAKGDFEKHSKKDD